MIELAETEGEARQGLLSKSPLGTTSSSSSIYYRNSLFDPVRRQCAGKRAISALLVVGCVFAALGILFSLALVSGGIGIRGWSSSTNAALTTAPTTPTTITDLAEMPATTWNGFENLEYLIVFGDSYSSLSFEADGVQPNAANPFGNPEMIFMRSAMLYWPFWLTLQHNKSAILTYNYAFGGATVDPKLSTAVGGDIENCLINQVMTKYLPAYMSSPSKAVWQGRNTLHAFFFGINDVIVRSMMMTKPSFPEYRESYLHSVERVYLSGARTFLFFNTPPLHWINQLPEQRDPAVGQMFVDWNEQVVAPLSALLKAKHPEVRTYTFDTFSLYKAAMNNPQAFPETAHLKNVTHYCKAYEMLADVDHYIPECIYPIREYFWLNGAHPTYAIMNATAARVASDCFGPEKTGFCS